MTLSVAAAPTQRVTLTGCEVMDRTMVILEIFHRNARSRAAKAQVEIASALRVKQPSISKIEKQADMYLSTLRSYVEAIGGKLELVVRLPSRAPVRIDHLGDVAPSVSADPRKVTAKRQTKPRASARVG